MTRAYGARGAGTGGRASVTSEAFPRTMADFGPSGGAYPECAHVQFPGGCGWSSSADAGEAPASLMMDYETLCATAAARAFEERWTTPEWEGFLAHVGRCVERGEGDWTQIVSEVGALEGATAVRRVRDFDPSLVEAEFLLAGEGEPVVFEDGGRDWKRWRMEDFSSVIGSTLIRCNDRAPARRSEEGPKQRTHQLPFDMFVEYVRNREGESGSGSLIGQIERDHVPFYANGMQAFSDPVSGEELSRAFPHPYFVSSCDQTEGLVRSVMQQLSASLRVDGDAASNIEKMVSKSLDKVFCGPRFTITRLHFDSHDAHGYLGQVEGRKLFVFFPPSDASKLGVIPTENSHARVDPLCPDLSRFPEFRDARPRVCVLSPGEVVLNPRGWWHYAVALDSSVTVMRNFFNARTNLEALVRMLLTTTHERSRQLGGAGPRSRG